MMNKKHYQVKKLEKCGNTSLMNIYDMKNCQQSKFLTPINIFDDEEEIVLSHNIDDINILDDLLVISTALIKADSVSYFNGIKIEDIEGFINHFLPFDFEDSFGFNSLEYNNENRTIELESDFIKLTVILTEKCVQNNFINKYDLVHDDKIFILTMEDYEETLKQYHSEEEIEYINNKFTKEQIKEIVSNKICIEWDDYIDAVINTILLDKYRR